MNANIFMVMCRRRERELKWNVMKWVSMCPSLPSHPLATALSATLGAVGVAATC